MAKGNMFQGMARGKVGDVVFSRLNGEQVSRVRNRHPNNPKTDPQLYQRAIMATIMRAYGAGKAIFDHSFQNKKQGSECMAEFMRVNAVKLRAALASDLSTGDNTARFVKPGAYMPVPNEYIVSDGSYTQSLFDSAGMLPAPLTDETVAEYCSRNNIIANDLYTLVGFVAKSSDADVQPECEFFFIRMRVKESALADTTVITLNSAKSLIFEVTASSGVSLTYALGTLGDAFDITAATNLNSNAGAWGIIRSRTDEDLRSRTVLTFNLVDTFGIDSAKVLGVWQAGAESIGDSSLILEGGSENAVNF